MKLCFIGSGIERETTRLDGIEVMAIASVMSDYFDTLVFTAEGLRHLAAEVGASQLVIGTDSPYPWTTTAADHVLNTPTLSDAEKLAILQGTAAKLLNISTQA